MALAGLAVVCRRRAVHRGGQRGAQSEEVQGVDERRPRGVGRGRRVVRRPAAVCLRLSMCYRTSAVVTVATAGLRGRRAPAAPRLRQRPSDAVVGGGVARQPALATEQLDRERVGDQHDEKRDEEGGQRAVTEEVSVEDGAERVAAGVEHVSRLEYAEQHDGAGDGERDAPHGRHLDARRPARLDARAQRMPDADVAVHRNSAHVHYRRRAHRHVEHLPYVAHHQVERPVACNRSGTVSSMSNTRICLYVSCVLAVCSCACGCARARTPVRVCMCMRECVCACVYAMYYWYN